MSGSDSSKVTGSTLRILTCGFRRKQRKGSPFLKLSHDLLNDRILPFLWRRNWELREFPVPETWRKELRLPPESLSDKASDMLKRDDKTTAPKHQSGQGGGRSIMPCYYG